jgi:hypothetical protein
MLAVIASLVLWKASALCHLWSFPCGMEAVLITDSLSPNIMVAPFTDRSRSVIGTIACRLHCFTDCETEQLLFCLFSQLKSCVIRTSIA